MEEEAINKFKICKLTIGSEIPMIKWKQGNKGRKIKVCEVKIKIPFVITWNRGLVLKRWNVINICICNFLYFLKKNFWEE